MSQQARLKKLDAFIKEYLYSREGTDVPIADLDKAIPDDLKYKGEPIQQKTWQKIVARLNALPLGPHLSLRFERRTESNKESYEVIAVHVESSDHYDVNKRKDERPETKARLGRALWNLLLRRDVFGGVGRHMTERDPKTRGCWENLCAKLDTATQGGVLTLLIDAGSTSEAFVEQLQSIEDIARIPHLDGARRARLRMEPRIRILTSSLNVANAVRSSKHIGAIELILTGGQVWPNYGSMAGLLTQKVLPIFGETLNNCVAIVGATGWRPAGIYGRSGLLCNSLEELCVKDWFIRNSFLSICLMDASKAKKTGIPRVFAPLAAVDVVITDDGTDETDDKDLPAAVVQLQENARVDEVTAVVVQASSRRPGVAKSS